MNGAFYGAKNVQKNSDRESESGADSGTRTRTPCGRGF